MAQKLLRLLSFLVLTCFLTLPNASGQQQHLYKNLRTAISTVVFDTIAGVNLDINQSNPQAQHGDVDVRVITQGGSGNPYVYEVSYTPDAGFVGVDSFVLELRYINTFPYLIYRAFRVSVWPSQVEAVTDYATTATGSPITLDVLANDLGPWGPLYLSGISLVNNGTANISGNQIVFMPDAGFLGIAHLNYTVCDALNTCKTGSAHIGIHNGLPPGDTLRIFTNKNNAITVPLAFDGYSLHQAPEHGAVTLQEGRAFTYKPDIGHTGPDFFLLKTNANGIDFFKRVEVKVYPVQTPNYMAVDDVRFTPKNNPITFNVRDNDIGNLLVRNWTVPNGFPGTLSGTNGVGNVTFTPTAGFAGPASFYYKIGNASATSLETATVTVVVDNLAPPATVLIKRLHTPKETPLVIHYEIPYTDFSFGIIETPLHGTMESFPGFSTQTINGQTVSGHNLLVYTPEIAFVGEDEFALMYCAPNGECTSSKIKVWVDAITVTEAPYCIASCAWPGDVNADGVVNNHDLLPMALVMGEGGSGRIDGDMTWYGQYAENWENPYPGFPQDVKHVDTNGDGVINAQDVATIVDNYKEIHKLIPKPVNFGKGLPFGLKLLTPNPEIGDPVKIEISLGNANMPALDIIGFTFNLALSPGLVDSAFKMTFLENSWLNLNSPDIRLAHRASAGKFDLAFSRTNGNPVSGEGVIGVMDFVIIEIIIGGGQNERASLTLNPTIMLADGSTLDGAPVTLDLPIKAKDRSQAMPVPAEFSVYPSPAKDRVFVTWTKEVGLQSLQLQDMQGQLIVEVADLAGSESAEFNVSQLPIGMYLLSARTETGFIAKKIQVVR